VDRYSGDVFEEGETQKLLRIELGFMSALFPNGRLYRHWHEPFADRALA